MKIWEKHGDDMSRKTHEPHSKRLTELFRNKTAFVSLLKDCVRAEWIDDLDIGSLRRSDKSYILQDFKKKEADIVYECTLRNGRLKVIFYVLLELQTKVDYRMPYRLLLYIVEILRDYYNSADAKARLRKGFRFPAVVPIVYYSGRRRWTAPTRLREMFDGHERFGDSLINFNYNLVDVKGYDRESVQGFHSRLLKVMMMLEKAKNIAELSEAVEKYNDDIKQFDDEELRIIAAALDILRSLYESGEDGDQGTGDALHAISAEGVKSMFADLIANEKKARRELINQAREETRQETREETRQEERKLREQEIEKERKLREQEIEKERKLREQEIEKERRLREQEKIETAQTLLGMGMSAENVAIATKLDIDRVEELKAGV